VAWVDGDGRPSREVRPELDAEAGAGLSHYPQYSFPYRRPREYRLGATHCNLEAVGAQPRKTPGLLGTVATSFVNPR
jgi:hypothetical protein